MRDVSIVLVTCCKRILFIQRPLEVRSFPGYWVTPGGKLDEPESSMGCAERELLEECGLDAKRKLKFIDSAPWQDKLISAFHLEITENTLPRVTIEEGMNGFGWFCMDELKSLRVGDNDMKFIEKLPDSVLG